MSTPRSEKSETPIDNLDEVAAQLQQVFEAEVIRIVREELAATNEAILNNTKFIAALWRQFDGEGLTDAESSAQ